MPKKYPNGRPRPQGLHQGKAELDMKQELGKLWREVDYLNEQVEQLSLQVSELVRHIHSEH